MEVRAEIVRLHLAETFVISRESQDWADVVHVTIAHDGHRRARRGGADRALRGDGGVRARVRRAPRPPRRRRPVRARGGRRAPRRSSTASRRRSRALDAALHDLQGKLLGVPVNRLLGLPARGSADLVDGLARRPGRHGPTGGRGGAALPAPQAQARRRRRPRRRARPRRARGHRPAAAGRRQRVVDSRRGARRVRRARDARRRVRRAAAPRGRPGGAELRRRSPIPIYVDEDCHTLADVAAVPRDRARRQHQAREVGRHPRGDPDGARRPRARTRRDARLHGRVRASGSPPDAPSRRSATTSTSTATCCSPTTPLPGPAFVDGVQVASTEVGLGCG